jgi:agmatine deiminase
VHINVRDKKMEHEAIAVLETQDVNLDRVRFFYHPTNDAWCRDHGPAFLINPESRQPKVIVDWGHNAWGGKYPPFDLDDVIPTLIAKEYNIPVYHPGIIMEGGSVDFNGEKTLITSTSCLLNPNRNPHLNQSQIENYLFDYYGVEQCCGWMKVLSVMTPMAILMTLSGFIIPIQSSRSLNITSTMRILIC